MHHMHAHWLPRSSLPLACGQSPPWQQRPLGLHRPLGRLLREDELYELEDAGADKHKDEEACSGAPRASGWGQCSTHACCWFGVSLLCQRTHGQLPQRQPRLLGRHHRLPLASVFGVQLRPVACTCWASVRCLVANHARRGQGSRTCEPRRSHCGWSAPRRTRRNACERALRRGETGMPSAPPQALFGDPRSRVKRSGCIARRRWRACGLRARG
jgi:hypothetical protein